jgi:hypothetical protein
VVGKQIPDYPPSLDATMTLFRERDRRYHPGRHEAKRQLGQIDIVHGLSSRLGCHYRAAVLAVRFFAIRTTSTSCPALRGGDGARGSTRALNEFVVEVFEVITPTHHMLAGIVNVEDGLRRNTSMHACEP